MKPSLSAVASIPENASWSAAVVPLPCRLSTNGVLLRPEYPLGTCTMIVRMYPPIDGVNVLEPAPAEPHPVLLTAVGAPDVTEDAAPP
jgi:hypothetical protein